MKICFNGRRFVTGVALFASLIMQGIPTIASASVLAPTPLQVDTVITAINPRLSFAVRYNYAIQTLAAAREAQIDPCLLIAIVTVESHWQASAISPHGAIGLGQLKPQTAASLHANPYSPSENLRATSQYLRLLLDQFAGPSENVTAIAAYNAGPGAIARNHNLPPNASNRLYVRRVLDVWAQTRTIIAQSTPFQEPDQASQPQQNDQTSSWHFPILLGHHHRSSAAPNWGNQNHSDDSDLSYIP